MAAITDPGSVMAAITDPGSVMAAITYPPGSVIDGIGYCVIMHG